MIKKYQIYLEKEKESAGGAPAVVGSLSVSNDIISTSGLSFGSKKKATATQKTETPKAESGGAPAVVGSLSVSNDIISTSGLSFGKKATCTTSSAAAPMPKGLTKKQQREWLAAQSKAPATSAAAPVSKTTSQMPKGLTKKQQREWLAAQSKAPEASAPSPTVAIEPARAAIAPGPKPAFVSTVAEARREKPSTIRKATAKAMRRSWENVAYVNLVHRANVTELWDYRASIKDALFELNGTKITFLAFVVKAVALALKEFEIFGAKYDEAADEIVFPAEVNMGIAVDTEHGLFVPVLKNADKKNIVQIADEIVALAKAARNKALKPDQMKGATFTITNYGSVGSLWGVPVINFPEVGIMGLGAIIDEAIIVKGEPKAGKVLYLTTAADHRWIDGSTIGKFTSRVVQLLENPKLLGAF